NLRDSLVESRTSRLRQKLNQGEQPGARNWGPQSDATLNEIPTRRGQLSPPSKFCRSGNRYPHLSQSGGLCGVWPSFCLSYGILPPPRTIESRAISGARSASTRPNTPRLGIVANV